MVELLLLLDLLVLVLLVLVLLVLVLLVLVLLVALVLPAGAGELRWRGLRRDVRRVALRWRGLLRGVLDAQNDAGLSRADVADDVAHEVHFLAARREENLGVQVVARGAHVLRGIRAGPEEPVLHRALQLHDAVRHRDERREVVLRELGEGLALQRAPETQTRRAETRDLSAPRGILSLSLSTHTHTHTHTRRARVCLSREEEEERPDIYIERERESVSCEIPRWCDRWRVVKNI